MNKEFLRLKQQTDFSQDLDKFKEQLHLMGISRKKSKKLENEIFKFIFDVARPVHCYVEHKYLREDVMNKIKEKYGAKGLKLASAVPAWVIESIIESWQDDLGEAESYWDTNWNVLNYVLSEESWLSCFKYYTREQMTIYACYIKDWYLNHQANEKPVCIREFFECEMQDEELKKYYLNLANLKKSN